MVGSKATRSATTKADLYVKRLVTANPNLLVPHYLMACFLYYKMDSPVVSDKLFDEMTQSLIEKWDIVQHAHKHLITMEDLVAGTGFAIEYPQMVRGAARHLLMLHQQGKLTAGSALNYVEESDYEPPGRQT